MKWSKQEEILLVSHFRNKTLSICRRVRIAKEALNFVTHYRTLDAIRSKARRLGLIDKREDSRVLMYKEK